MLDVRDRISERLNRARIKLEIRRGAKPLAVVAVAAVAGILCWSYILGNVGGGIFNKTQTVKIAVRDATGVVAKRDEVRVKGIPAGTIKSVDYEGDEAILTLSVERRYGSVYRDARFALRPNTALQDMYVDVLDLGDKQAGTPDEDKPLDAGRTSTSINVSDVLQTFDPPTRAKTAAVLRDLGAGLKDRGLKLNAAFAEVAPFVRNAQNITDQVARRSTQTKRLVKNTAVLTDELARRQVLLRRLVRDGADTLQTVADHSQGLDGTLRQLPPTLNAVDASFASVRGVLDDVDGAVGQLRPTARQLPGALKAVEDLSANAAPAISALKPPVRKLVPLSDALPRATDGLARAVTRLRTYLPTIDHITSTVQGCVKTTGLQKFFQNTASTFKYQDERGVIARGDFSGGAESLGLGSLTATDPAERPTSQSCAPGAPIEGTP